MGESVPREARVQRMNLFVRFMKQIEQALPGADDHISEVDLSDATDIRATLTGLGAAAGNSSPIWLRLAAKNSMLSRKWSVASLRSRLPA